MKMLDEKQSVLFIGAPFFNYYKKIIGELEKQGYVVDYYNDRPSENCFIKGIIKLKKNFLSIMISRYFNRIIKETTGKKYRLIFILNCKVFTPDMIKRLKTSQPEAKFVLYMWDSFELYPMSKTLVPYFDKVFSFDSEDCKNNSKVEFLPLFFSEEFEEIGACEKKDFEYDVVSVCTAHPNRYQIIKTIIPFLKRKGVRVYSYLFLNWLQFLYNKFFDEAFRRAKIREFRFSPLSFEQNLNLIKKSIAVFDIQHSQQSGLTMRCIETLGAKRKLITYNKNISLYDFYKKENILILSADNQDEIIPFLKRKYEEIDVNIYRKYSLESWIKKIVSV